MHASLCVCVCVSVMEVHARVCDGRRKFHISKGISVTFLFFFFLGKRRRRKMYAFPMVCNDDFRACCISRREYPYVVMSIFPFMCVCVVVSYIGGWLPVEHSEICVGP